MTDAPFLPALPDDWEPTRATLHAYAHAVGAIPRSHGTFHDKWWHISLKVVPDGLTTDAIGLPEGGTLRLMMDLKRHEVVLTTGAGDRSEFSMTSGLTGTQLGDRLIDAAGELGLKAEYDRERFENEDSREYDPAAASLFLTALVNVAGAFENHRAAVGPDVGPVQVWPHGFDISFEWFGTRVATYEEDGEVTEYPSQLNLGWYPAGRAYFYSNPFPFDGDALTSVPLPHGAEWHTEGWQGSILYYDQLQGAAAAAKLAEYAKAVYDAAAPTLMA